MTLSAPAPLAEHHALAEFNSGVGELDDWLRRRARSNQASGASRTFLVCDESRVIAYYAFASGAVKQPEAHRLLSLRNDLACLRRNATTSKAVFSEIFHRRSPTSD